MPNGAWRGTIERIDSRGLYVKIPRFNPNTLWGPVEPAPGDTYALGDGVLCMFYENYTDRIEIVRRVVTVQLDVFTESFGGTF